MDEVRIWRTYVALTIALVWAVSYIVSVATRDYSGFEVSTPVMLIAAAYLLTVDVRRNGGKPH